MMAELANEIDRVTRIRSVYAGMPNAIAEIDAALSAGAKAQSPEEIEAAIRALQAITL